MKKKITRIISTTAITAGVITGIVYFVWLLFCPNDMTLGGNVRIFMSKALRNGIRFEYLFVLIGILLIYLLPLLILLRDSNNNGIDGIGEALAFVILIRLFRAVVAFVLLFVNPIRILIKYHSAYGEAVPKVWGILSIIVTLLPVFAALLVIFEVQIDNWFFNRKYCTAPGGYRKDEADYVKPSVFFWELGDRGLLAGEKYYPLIEKLNGKYAPQSVLNSKAYYPLSRMSALRKSTYYDKMESCEAILPDSEVTAPVYIYHAILAIPEEGGMLQYIPAARFQEQGYIKGNFAPLFQDFYLECKIIFADGDLYAVIGSEESFDIRKSFDEKKIDMDDRPYQIILTEKDTITTYAEEQYCPNGSIRIAYGDFEMLPNTEKPFCGRAYPLRKVERIDADTINRIAAEMQNGILKDAVEYHLRIRS
ncbi:MAG: hypothetical protein J5845_05515 [Lachnospiraceae bacterium]|nr:hypothetical protein [Lachnospiraceae bacterium]